MSLKAQIVADLTAAMKAGAERKKNTLRMLKAELMKEEVAGAVKKELTEGEVVAAVRRLIKQRRDSAAQFLAGGRAESAAEEEAEIVILEAYLPAQLAAAELAAIVVAKKAELGVTDKSGLGKLIGAVKQQVGDSADGATVKAAVEASFA